MIDLFYTRFWSPRLDVNSPTKDYFKELDGVFRWCGFGLLEPTHPRQRRCRMRQVLDRLSLYE